MCVLSSEHPLSPEVTVTDSTPYTIVLTMDHSEVCFEDYTFHYKISWSRADGEWSLPVEVPLIPSYTITDLSPSSEYRVRVLAESEEDSTVVSGPVTVRAITLGQAGVCLVLSHTHACTHARTCMHTHIRNTPHSRSAYILSFESLYTYNRDIPKLEFILCSCSQNGVLIIEGSSQMFRHPL